MVSLVPPPPLPGAEGGGLALNEVQINFMRKHSPDKFALFTKQIRRTWPRRQGSDDDEVINMRRRMFQEHS